MFQYPKGAAVDKYIYHERKEEGPVDLLLILFLGGGIYCKVLDQRNTAISWFTSLLTKGSNSHVMIDCMTKNEGYDSEGGRKIRLEQDY